MTLTEYRNTVFAEHLAEVGRHMGALNAALNTAAVAARTFMPMGQLVRYRDPANVDGEYTLARVSRKLPHGAFITTSIETGREHTWEFDPPHLDTWSFTLVDEDDRHE